jgi:internalin A
MRFVRGDQSLRLDMADRLANYFGLTLSRGSRKGTDVGKSPAAFLVAVSVIACGSGLLAEDGDRARQQAIAAIEHCGGQVRVGERSLGKKGVEVHFGGKSAGTITDRDLAFLKAIPDLKGLCIWWPGGRVTGDGLSHIRELRQLERLVLYGVNMTDDSLSALEGLTELRELSIAGGVTDAGLKHLAPLTKLRHLDFQEATIAGDGLNHLQRMATLEELNLSRADVQGDALAPIDGLASVAKLTLAYAKVTDSQLRHLKGLRNLKDLEMVGVQVDGSGFESLRGLPKFEHLSLYKAAVTDQGISSIRGLLTLKSLNIGGTRITDSGLTQLETLSNLESLTAYELPISDEGMVHIGALRNLKSLCLNRTKVTDRGLSHLSKLSDLEELYLLELPVTGKGLAQLRGLKKLRRIWIMPGLTDDGLAELKAFTGLRELRAEGNKITDAAIRELQRALPGLVVYH